MAGNILIVEDEKRVRDDIKNTLVKIDLRITRIYQAANGREALELLRNHPIDLLLTDINMPEMNGLEMLGQMRSDSNYSEIPTIVISSRRDPKLLNAIRNSGLGFLPKPFSWRDLRKKVLNYKDRFAEYVEEA